MENITDRFLRYVGVPTTSNEASDTQPSSNCQLNLLNMLVDELKDMGVEASIDQWGYVMATIPSNIEKEVPKVGFIAHVDTSPDALGENIKPQIISNYNGADIVLNKEKNIVLSVTEFPELLQYKGQTIITTDGTTLLGADDKAGVAEIMSAVEYIVNTPSFKHGEIKIGFTPDEEIGRGVDYFDVAKFGADYAYTFDGGEIGELEFENFNAASAKITIKGRNIHPGYAKDKMINSILIAMEINSMLPVHQRPEHTCNYEGFYHVVGISGSVEEASLSYIIRDHSLQEFYKKQEYLKNIIAFINNKYGSDIVTLELKEQYLNMREMVEKEYHIVEKAIEAMSMAGINAKVKPIRGGTDGARLSFMGLPTPNIFAGGHNFHSRMEYVPIESMEKAKEVMLNIISLYTK